MARRDKGYLIPSEIYPVGRRCIKFYVPDDLLYLANFWGAVSELGKWFNYEQNGTNEGALVAELMREMIATSQQFYDNGEECALPIQMRRNPSTGDIEWRPDGAATWESLGDGCGCTPDKAVPTVSTEGTGDEIACNMAVGISTYIFEKFGDTIDAIETAVDTVAAFDVITSVFSIPAYIIADQVMDVIAEITEAGSAAARAFDTVEHREEVGQYWYCEVLKGMTPPEVQEGDYETFKDWAFDEYNFTGLGAGLFLQFLSMIKEEAIMDRARVASYSDENCAAFNCAGWVKEFDFTIAPQAWAAVSGTSGWWARVDGQGMVANKILLTGSTYRRGVRVEHTIPATFEPHTLTEIDVEFTLTGTGSTTAVWIDAYEGETLLRRYTLGASSPQHVDVLDTETDRLVVNVNIDGTSAQMDSAVVKVAKITLSGLGQDPYGL